MTNNSEREYNTVQKEMACLKRSPKPGRGSPSKATARGKGLSARGSSLEWQATFDALPELIAIVDTRRRVVRCNRAMLEFLKKPASQVIGRRCYKLFHAASPPLECPFSRMIRSMQRETMDLTLGERRCRVIVDPILGPQGELSGAVHVVHDVTEQKRMEETLRVERDQFRQYLEVASVMFLVLDVSGKVKLINRRGCEILEGKEWEIVGKNWFDTFVPPRCRQEVKNVFEKLMAGETLATWYYENAVLTLKWRERLVAWHNTILRDEAGRITGTLSAGLDVTESRKADEELRAQNRFRESVIARAAEGICVCRDIPRFPFIAFTVWNDRMTEITGYTMEEINRLGWYQTMYPDPELQRRAADRMDRMRKGADLIGEEWEITRKDGQKRIVRMSTSVLRTEEGSVHVLALMEDVTDRRRLDDLLRTESSLGMALASTSSLEEGVRLCVDAAVAVSGMDGGMVYVADRSGRTFDLAVSRGFYGEIPAGAVRLEADCPCMGAVMEGRRIYLEGGDFGGVGAGLAAALKGDGMMSAAVVPVSAGGEVRMCMVVASRRLDRVSSDQRKVLDVLVPHMGSAVARLSAEEKAREAGVRLEAAVKAANVGLFDWDLTTNKVLYSSEWKRQLGYGDHEISDDFEEWQSRLHPDDRDRMLDTVRRYLKDPWPGYRVEFRLRHKDGSYRWILTQASLIRDENGVPVRMLGSHIDITETKRLEESLRASEEKYRAVTENTIDILYQVDSEGILRFIGPQVRRYGYDPDTLVGRPILEFVCEEDRAGVEGDFRETIETGREFLTRFRAVGPTGALVWMEENGRVQRDAAGRIVGITGILRDVTDRVRAEEERARLEEQLRQSQKMEAIGRFAGGIAHDFNNMITAVAGYTQMVRESLAADDPRRASLDEVLRASERAASLTRQLLAFGRRQVMHPRVIDLNEVVRHVEGMLRRVIGEDIELISRLDPRPALVKADPGQLEQMLLNLAVNSRDAMPEGGRITVETRVIEAATGSDGAPAPACVELVFSDTGIGMSDEIMARAFEPFFTTKEAGSGTGLGLSIVYGIVQQSGGRIDLASEPGKGAAFTIRLPAAEGLPEPVAARRVDLVPRGSETVLVAEDEDVVRRLASGILEGQGYRVLEAQDGRTAISTAERHQGVIHLLLTDMVMPGMSGRELAVYLRAARPGIRIVYMSGYAEEAVSKQGKIDPDGIFLSKPFTPGDLARAVRAALDRPAGVPAASK